MFIYEVIVKVGVVLNYIIWTSTFNFRILETSLNVIQNSIKLTLMTSMIEI